MTATRRSLVQFAGGAAAGALFTPAPWRLITDSALWSQSWPGVPRPARGEIKYKNTLCTLCPAGCAVRARCVGEQPVALAGANGGLCPYGVTGHHLPYHPSRLKTGDEPGATAAITAALARTTPTERIAVLDLRPARTASWTYRRAMATVPNGTYVAPEQPTAAVSFENVTSVLSIGAPLLDGWGTPATIFRARPSFRLIQAEAVESRTASLADQWLPIRPGSEQALALGLANGDLARASEATGLSVTQLEGLLQPAPSLVMDRTLSPAVITLNQKLGNWGRTVGPRLEPPVPDSWKKAAPVSALSAVADNSIRILLIDESEPDAYIPWPQIERKLVRDNPVVVAFAWSEIGYGRHATFALPTAVYPELATDLPPAIDSLQPAFRPAEPLLSPPANIVNPSAFIAKIAGMNLGDPLKERAAAVGQALPPAQIVTAPAPPQAFDPAYPLTLILTPERGAATLISPLMTKLYQESNVRLAPNRVALHPKTAQAAGLAEGARATLETPSGKCPVQITLDSSVPQNAAQAADRPGIADIAAGATSARVVRA